MPDQPAAARDASDISPLVIIEASKVVRQLIWAVAVVFMIYFGLTVPIRETAGQETVLAVAYRAVLDLKVHLIVPYVAALCFFLLWRKERTTRIAAVARENRRNRELEKKLDPRRTSSGFKGKQPAREQPGRSVMDAQDQVAIAQLCLSLGLVGVAFGYMNRRTRADRYRENLFTLRDELFDYMWKHDISFDIPAYRLMRTSLNGAIRAVGAVSPLAFVGLMFWLIRRAPARPDRFRSAISDVEDEGLRERLVQTQRGCAQALLGSLGVLGVILRVALRLERFRRWARAQANVWVEGLVVFGNHSPDARSLFGSSSRLVIRR